MKINLWKIGLAPTISFGTIPDTSDAEPPDVTINTTNGAIEHQISQKPIYKIGEIVLDIEVLYRMPNSTEIMNTVQKSRNCPNPTASAKQLDILMSEAIKQALGEDHENFQIVTTTSTPSARKRRTTATSKPLPTRGTTVVVTQTTSTTSTTTTTKRTTTTPPEPITPKSITTNPVSAHLPGEILGVTDGMIYQYAGIYTFDGATAKCKSISGRIPSPNSRNQNDFIASLSPETFWLNFHTKEAGILLSTKNTIEYTNFNEYWEERIQDNKIDPDMATIVLADADSNTNQWKMVNKLQPINTVCETPKPETTAIPPTTPEYATITATTGKITAAPYIPNESNEIYSETIKMALDDGEGEIELIGMTKGEIKLAKDNAETLFKTWKRSKFPEESAKEYFQGDSEANPFLRANIQGKPIKPLIKFLYEEDGRTTISLGLSYRSMAKMANLDSKLLIVSPTLQALENKDHLFSVRIVYYAIVSDYEYSHYKLNNVRENSSTQFRQLSKKRNLKSITICRKDESIRIPAKSFVKCTTQTIPIQINSTDVMEINSKLCQYEPCWSILGLIQTVWIPIEHNKQRFKRQAVIGAAAIGSAMYAGIESVRNYFHRNQIDDASQKFRSISDHIDDLQKGITRTLADEEEEILHLKNDQVKIEQIDQNLVCSVETLQLETVVLYIKQKLNDIINGIETEGLKATSHREHLLGQQAAQLCMAYNRNIDDQICNESGIWNIKLKNISHNGNILVGTFSIQIPALEQEMAECTVSEQHFIPILIQQKTTVIAHRIDLSPRIRVNCEDNNYYFNLKNALLLRKFLLLSLEDEEFSSECRLEKTRASCPIESILTKSPCSRSLYKDLQGNLWVGISSTDEILEARYNTNRIAGLHSKADGMQSGQRTKLYAMSRQTAIKITCGPPDKRKTYTLTKSRGGKKYTIKHVEDEESSFMSLESHLADQITKLNEKQFKQYWDSKRARMKIQGDLNRLNRTKDAVLSFQTPLGEKHVTNQVIWTALGIVATGAVIFILAYCSFIKIKEYCQRVREPQTVLLRNTQSRLSNVYHGGRASAHL